MKNILLITIATMLILGACKRDNSISNLPDVYHYLTLSQIQKTPYFINPDFDTLTFVSNKNDTLIFAKIKTDTSYYKTYERWCFDCRTQTNYHQTLRNTYQTLKGNGKFEVRHVLNDGNKFNTIQIFFNDYAYGIGDWQIGLKEYVGYVGDFNIRNNTYNEVLMLGNKGSLSYLNLNLGVFYIDDIPNNINYLLIK